MKRPTKILPTNVEKHMMTHPAIVDVAVVGLPHEEDGERPLAFVVLSENSKEVTAEELISYTNGKFKAISWRRKFRDLILLLIVIVI